MSVYLVGAGPGDPGLITVRGLDLLRRADAVVVDELVAPELLDETRPQALVVSRVGLRQDAINDLLVSLGRRGLDVVRLKGGDPFVFGRGGEEAHALAEAGVPFEVVPGVSSLSAVPASAGIPITYRGVAAQVTFASGQSASGEELDCGLLARTPGTLVLFMALAQAERITERLIGHGKDPVTPAAVISRGTRPDERVAIGTLRMLPQLARGLLPPALVVIGDVVAARSSTALEAVAALHAA